MPHYIFMARNEINLSLGVNLFNGSNTIWTTYLDNGKQLAVLLKLLGIRVHAKFKVLKYINFTGNKMRKFFGFQL